MRSRQPMVLSRWVRGGSRCGEPRGAGRRSASRTRSRARAGCLRAWSAQCDYRRGRCSRRARHLNRGRSRSHRRHGDRSARGQCVPGQGSGRGVRRQRLRQAGRFDAGRRAGHDRNADCADQHAERGCRRRRVSAVDDRSGRQRERAIGERAGRRDQRRRAQRHSRPACASRARARRDQVGDRRAGSRGQRRRRHRNTGVRLEGRHRHRVAQARRALRRLHRRRAGAIELRRRADHGRRAGREGAWPLLTISRSAPARPGSPTRGLCALGWRTITATGRA